MTTADARTLHRVLGHQIRLRALADELSRIAADLDTQPGDFDFDMTVLADISVAGDRVSEAATALSASTGVS